MVFLLLLFLHFSLCLPDCTESEIKHCSPPCQPGFTCCPLDMQGEGKGPCSQTQPPCSQGSLCTVTEISPPEDIPDCSDEEVQICSCVDGGKYCCPSSAPPGKALCKKDYTDALVFCGTKDICKFPDEPSTRIIKFIKDESCLNEELIVTYGSMGDMKEFSFEEETHTLELPANWISGIMYPTKKENCIKQDDHCMRKYQVTFEATFLESGADNYDITLVDGFQSVGVSVNPVVEGRECPSLSCDLKKVGSQTCPDILKLYNEETKEQIGCEAIYKIYDENRPETLDEKMKQMMQNLTNCYFLKDNTTTKGDCKKIGADLSREMVGCSCGNHPADPSCVYPSKENPGNPDCCPFLKNVPDAVAGCDWFAGEPGHFCYIDEKEKDILKDADHKCEEYEFNRIQQILNCCEYGCSPYIYPGKAIQAHYSARKPSLGHSVCYSDFFPNPPKSYCNNCTFPGIWKEKVCKQSYSWQFDDKSSDVSCVQPSGYEVTFHCPDWKKNI